jgi:hypothetical protein
MTRTEAALRALVAIIAAAAAVTGAAIPLPLRNQALPKRLVELSTGIETHLNIWDGSGQPTDEMLGADIIADGYELEQLAKIEWAVAARDDTARENAFDAGVRAIAAAIAADRTLGGVVDRAAITQLNGLGSGLSTDGLPNIKAVEIIVSLQFLSSEPF